MSMMGKAPLVQWMLTEDFTLPADILEPLDFPTIVAFVVLSPESNGVPDQI
jgi:hypothetical protein